jgi:hypothetical protein
VIVKVRDMKVRLPVSRFGPEAAVDPDAFFDALAPRCTPPKTSHEDLVLIAGS